MTSLHVAGSILNMGAHLDDLERQRDMLLLLDSRGPKDYGEAIAHILGRRKELLMGELDFSPAHRVIEISHELDALVTICDLIGSAMPKGKARNARAKEKGVSREDHAIRMGRMLTPPNWRKRIEVPLEKAQDEARQEMLVRKNIDKNRAFLEESRRVLRFLEVVEREMERAFARVRRVELRKVAENG